MGCRLTKQLLSRGRFTALFAYNDILAIGAIRAIREAGLRVPEDISVVGFDDIREAAYQFPSLTTIHQPLRKMGEIAAETLVQRIEGRRDHPRQILIEPELVARESTAKAVPYADGAGRGERRDSHGAIPGLTRAKGLSGRECIKFQIKSRLGQRSTHHRPSTFSVVAQPPSQRKRLLG